MKQQNGIPDTSHGLCFMVRQFRAPVLNYAQGKFFSSCPADRFPKRPPSSGRLSTAQQRPTVMGPSLKVSPLPVIHVSVLVFLLNFGFLNFHCSSSTLSTCFSLLCLPPHLSHFFYQLILFVTFAFLSFFSFFFPPNISVLLSLQHVLAHSVITVSVMQF